MSTILACLPSQMNLQLIGRQIHSVFYSSSNTPNMNRQNLNCEERLVLFMFASHVQWYDTPWRQANTTRWEEIRVSFGCSLSYGACPITIIRLKKSNYIKTLLIHIKGIQTILNLMEIFQVYVSSPIFTINLF